MPDKEKTYHIIGGGVAGLAAAKFLRKKHKKAQIIIYEASSHLGGRCYSYECPKLQRTIDNATHAVLGANRVAKFFPRNEFLKNIYFFQDKKIHKNIWKEIPFILLSVFNTPAKEIAKPLVWSLGAKLFPFTKKQRKIYYSKGDLTANIVEPLTQYANEIKTGWVLRNVEIANQQISKLHFNHQTIELTEKDIIISALDAENYHKIFNGPKFEFNTICNIFYRTGTELTLPQNIPFVATPQSTADWIFINKDIVAVTISNFSEKNKDKEGLARKIWKEIRQINNIHAAFLPPFQVIIHKRATIKQDTKNNQLRPQNCRTKYKNLFLAGDWTMKNYPCCLEAAFLSGKRVSRSI